jgi:hypothetical protein
MTGAEEPLDQADAVFDVENACHPLANTVPACPLQDRDACHCRKEHANMH